MSTRSWWPQQLLIAWLNLVLTAPIIYIFIGLPLVLRQHDWSATQIGLLQLAGLPAVLKFILAAPIDRWRIGAAAGSYRAWTQCLGLAFAASLLALAYGQLGDYSFQVLFLLLMLASLLGTWADIPLNALAIQLLPESERVRAGSLRSLAASLGAIAGGGIMLMVQAKFGWRWPFLLFVIVLLPSLGLLSWLIPAKSAQQAPAPAPAMTYRLFIGYFKQAPMRYWSLLLLLYFPAIAASWIYLKPIMLDQGWQQQDIAMVVGVMGGVVAAVSSMAAGKFTDYVGARFALQAFSVLNIVTMLALWLVVQYPVPKPVFAAAAMLLALAMGASAGLLFSLMMNHTRAQLSALDYGLQSSLFIASRTLAPAMAGWLIDLWGYKGMFVLLAVYCVAVSLLVYHSRDRINLLAPAKH